LVLRHSFHALLYITFWTLAYLFVRPCVQAFFQELGQQVTDIIELSQQGEVPPLLYTLSACLRAMACAGGLSEISSSSSAALR
jgi:hypothetical protein